MTEEDITGGMFDHQGCVPQPPNPDGEIQPGTVIPTTAILVEGNPRFPHGVVVFAYAWINDNEGKGLPEPEVCMAAVPYDPEKGADPGDVLNFGAYMGDLVSDASTLLVNFDPDTLTYRPFAGWPPAGWVTWKKEGE